jgi:hypothetical protein
MEVKFQQSILRQLGSGFRTQMFSLLGGTSVVTETNLLESLENGKI